VSDQGALLLIGHGSRSKAGVAQFWQFVDVLRGAAPHLQIGAGLIEFAKPSLDEAIDRLVADGAASVVAVPLVLLGAGHMKDDGPAALARARQRHQTVAFSYARDLGVHPLVLEAVEERARAAVRRLPKASGSTALVVVGRGSTDPDANADLYKAARLLADHRAIAGDPVLDVVEPAFVSLADPSIGVAMDRARKLGSSRIAVAPYFLFSGVLIDRIGEEAGSWASDNPDIAVTVGDEIGPDGRIAALALERFDEAALGDARMNCDACMFRTPLPGFEDRVGQPLPGPHLP
jgi:sirohydrochlorin ferrochelatase